MATYDPSVEGRCDASAPGQPEQFIRLAQAGCPESLGELYERCRRYLLLIANQELDDRLRAKLGPSDVIQETLLSAQRNIGRFQGHSEAELRAWLRIILLNNVRAASRRYRAGTKRDLNRERPLEAVLTEPGGTGQFAKLDSPSKQVVASEENARVIVQLNQLSEDYRQVIVLRNFERRSFSEIGQAMNRSEGAARKLWLRALDRLAAGLGVLDESCRS